MSCFFMVFSHKLLCCKSIVDTPKYNLLLTSLGEAQMLQYANQLNTGAVNGIIGMGSREEVVVFLGAASVGKTAVITRFIDGYWVNKAIPTIGVDFTGRTVFIDGQSIRIQLWDTAGQERFHGLIPTCIYEAHRAVIVYDVSSKETFNDVRRWLKEIQKHQIKKVEAIIVGNKIDKKDREVTLEEAKSTFVSEGFPVIELSARTGENVTLLFETIARQVIQTFKEEIFRKRLYVEAEQLTYEE